MNTKPKDFELTRAEVLTKGKADIEYPELLSHEHLLDWFFEVGPSFDYGMGEIPLPHQEIRAWALNLNLQLRDYEALWLNKLSIAYVLELQRSRGKNATAPYESGR